MFKQFKIGNQPIPDADHISDTQIPTVSGEESEKEYLLKQPALEDLSVDHHPTTQKQESIRHVREALRSFNALLTKRSTHLQRSANFLADKRGGRSLFTQLDAIVLQLPEKLSVSIDFINSNNVIIEYPVRKIAEDLIKTDLLIETMDEAVQKIKHDYEESALALRLGIKSEERTLHLNDRCTKLQKDCREKEAEARSLLIRRLDLLSILDDIEHIEFLPQAAARTSQDMVDRLRRAGY
jgi:hypothetical protein